jgi:hypothetical protein
MTGSKRFFPLLFLTAAILTLPSFADDASPAIRAARLTYMQGSVTVTQENNTASVPAQLNLPLLAGVMLSTGEDGQAEIEFEDGSVIRLTPNSALTLDNLAVDGDGVFTTAVSLLHGLAYAELRATPKYRYTVNAGGDLLSPVENATVRVNFDEAPAIFAVIDGTAHIERQGAGSASIYQADVRAGETLRPDNADQGRYFLNQGIASDSWDQWNEDLDQAAAAQSSNSTAVRNNYAGAQGYGWSDLDANGSWYDVPGEGPVWQPSIAADDSDFDPYGNGAWVAYPSVGYVWASAYPWGWTPYRCGNWSFFTGFGWGWAPGAGCGGFGWGFWGGGRVVNIGRAPNGYLPIHVPVRHGPEKPLLPVHHDRGTAFAGAGNHRTGDHGPRQIGGVTATPIAPVFRGASPGGTAIGASLHRDFPVDSRTRTPVLGVAGTRPADIHPNSGARPNGARPQPPAASVWPSTSGAARTGQSRPGASSARPDPSSPQFQRPNPNVPTPRSAPPSSASPAHPTYTPPSQPAPHPTYTPPPSRSTEHPNYTPPPSQAAPHPTYTPPPSRPAEHPTYTPPPSQPAPHPSYSPPPPSHPAPAPASAPAPAARSPR